MTERRISFADGGTYEQTMGVWSRVAGEKFLGWLKPEQGLKWIDVGCGNGAFTDLIVERCAPAHVVGVDPSEGQIAYARDRTPPAITEYQTGNALDLPFSDNTFDAATMALVIFFVPDPAKAVAQMSRVVRPGGLISTYAWDMCDGGFPLEPLLAEMKAFGITPPMPPNIEASRLKALETMWAEAGIDETETCEFMIERPFASFDEYWSHVTKFSIAQAVTDLEAAKVDELRNQLRDRMAPNADGSLMATARVHAIRGRLPD